MMRPSLLRWQREGYPQFHQSRLNLWLHPPAVLTFVASSVAVVFAVFTGRWLLALAALAGVIVGFALQAVGHKREATPPIPFDGPVDLVSRIFVEQFVTFPWFALSGRWWAALREAKR
jgi:hypothetical protein